MAKEKKQVLADTSSLILLQRSGLLIRLLLFYDIMLADIVYHEICRGEGNDALELANLLSDRILPTGHIGNFCGKGAGEKATLALFEAGHAEFVLVDDKRAARNCGRQQIPFINSLLVPRILYFSGRLKRDACQRYIDAVRKAGFYGLEIVAIAETMTRDELAFFFP